LGNKTEGRTDPSLRERGGGNEFKTGAMGSRELSEVSKLGGKNA